MLVNTKMMLEKVWEVEVIDTPRDGSCFFSAIAMALNDSIEMWYGIDELRIPMEMYWGKYHEETNENLTEVTSDLIRYMCSINIDKNILETFNAEAEYRRETEKVSALKFNTPKELGQHIRNKTTWGDHASFHAFLKSLNFNCAIIVFDAELGGIQFLPREWLKNKKSYICLRFEDNHYGVIRLKKHNLCVTRETMIDMIESINKHVETDKSMDVDCF